MIRKGLELFPTGPIRMCFDWIDQSILTQLLKNSSFWSYYYTEAEWKNILLVFLGKMFGFIKFNPVAEQ